MKVTLVDGRTLLKWIEVANRSTLTQFGDEAGSLAELLVEQVTYFNISLSAYHVYQFIVIISMPQKVLGVKSWSWSGELCETSTVCEDFYVKRWSKWMVQNANSKLVIAAQIECADLIILSKVDCLQQTQISKCRTAIKALNPSAILEVCYLPTHCTKIFLVLGNDTTVLLLSSFLCFFYQPALPAPCTI